MVTTHNHSPDWMSNKWSPLWLTQGSMQRACRLLTGAAPDTSDRPQTTNLKKDHLSLHPIPTTQQNTTRQVHSQTPPGPLPHSFSGVSLLFLNNSMSPLLTSYSYFLLFLGIRQNKNQRKTEAGCSFGDCWLSRSKFPGLGWPRAKTGPFTLKESTSVPLWKQDKLDRNPGLWMTPSCLALWGPQDDEVAMWASIQPELELPRARRQRENSRVLLSVPGKWQLSWAPRNMGRTGTWRSMLQNTLTGRQVGR